MRLDGASKQFHNDIKKLTDDLELLWNPVIEHWEVYQVRKPLKGFVLPSHLAGAASARPVKLFTIEGPNGEFRQPGQQDLERVIRSINGRDFMQKHGSDAWVDHVEAKEKEREEQVAVKREEMLHYYSKDLKKAVKDL